MKFLFTTIALCCSFSCISSDSQTEAQIYKSVSGYLRTINIEKYIISPISNLSILDIEVFLEDSTGARIDNHFIIDGYTSFSKFSNSLDFVELKNRFVETNMNPILIDEHFMSVALDTLYIENYKSIFKSNTGINNQWDAFDKNFPASNGYLIISRPGISIDGKWAILYYEVYNRSSECEGNFILLRKVQNMWMVVESIQLWVS